MLRTRTSRLISEYRDLNSVLENNGKQKQKQKFHQLDESNDDDNGSEYNTKEEESISC
jgi:hypothetical protein